MRHNLQGRAQREAFPADNLGQSWGAAIAIAVVTAIAYFLAARLGLALISELEGVAVFWPASGIAAGILITLGSGARAPVSIGVIVATVVANLMGDRSLWIAIFNGLCNAGEAIFTAWLIERWFGRRFRLDDLQRVLGFLAAATLGAATAAIGGAVAMSLLHTTAPLLSIWRVWFLSDGLGIVTIAPLLIGLGQLTHERPPPRELIEGTLALVVLAAMSAFAFTAPPSSWVTLVPVAVLFPVLLLVAARYRPGFAASAAFIVGIALVWTTTFGIGRFGDPNAAIIDRVLAAQCGILVSSLCALVLAALFAERRRNEAALKDSNERLQLALGGADLGVWSVDIATCRMECDARDRRINGHDPDFPITTLAEAQRYVHSDDLPGLEAAFRGALQTGDRCRAEYRVRTPGRTRAARWVAVEGTVVRGAEGRPVRLLGVTRDVTERKLAEQNLRKQEQAFRELLGALPAAIYTTDAAGHITYCNQGAVDLWGVHPELGKDKWCEFSRFYYADGTPMELEYCATTIALKEGRIVQAREAIIERADGTRIPIVPYPTPLRDEAGAIVGAVNMTVDITERKQAELALAERNAQLALAGKTALVGSYAYAIDTGIMQVSAGYAAIYDLPEGTVEITREEWRARVYPDDLAKLDLQRRQAFAERRREHYSEYRIVRSGGETRWIESRSFIAYDGDGRARRMVGVNIDATERKHAEEHKNLLIAELDHRVKNVLAIVSAVASRTRETSSSMADFVTALDGRIKSMATTHELLSSRRWQGINLADLVRRELAPCAAEGNTTVEGTDVVLTAETAQSVAMVLHELVTNAAKYGALSSPQGHVTVRWDRPLNGRSSQTLVLEWRETGGPLVVAPIQSGYGTSVIRDLIPYELGGAVDLVFASEGVRCRLEIPLGGLSGDHRPRAATPGRADGTSVRFNGACKRAANGALT